MAQSVRKQIEELRDEFEAWRRSHAAPAGAEVSAAGQPPDPGVHGQITELNRLVQVMLEEAEETAANHPVATVAGALALGIVIGRLMAR